MFVDLVPWHELTQLVVTDERNFVDLVRGSKSIHKVEEGDPRFESSDLRYYRHVVCLLNAERRDHGKATATTKHGIAVITVNGQGLTGESSRCDMNNGR